MLLKQADLQRFYQFSGTDWLMCEPIDRRVRVSCCIWLTLGLWPMTALRQERSSWAILRERVAVCTVPQKVDRSSIADLAVDRTDRASRESEPAPLLRMKRSSALTRGIFKRSMGTIALIQRSGTGNRAAAPPGSRCGSPATRRSCLKARCRDGSWRLPAARSCHCWTSGDGR
jgi:hypothetical protein